MTAFEPCRDSTLRCNIRWLPEDLPTFQHNWLIMEHHDKDKTPGATAALAGEATSAPQDTKTHTASRSLPQNCTHTQNSAEPPGWHSLQNVWGFRCYTIVFWTKQSSLLSIQSLLSAVKSRRLYEQRLQKIRLESSGPLMAYSWYFRLYSSIMVLPLIFSCSGDCFFS